MMLDLFSGPVNGPEQLPADYARQARQRKAVFDLMADARWRTLADIASSTGEPEASVSARLRDFRKPKYGEHTVNKRRVRGPDGGTWEYQLQVAGARKEAGAQ